MIGKIPKPGKSFAGCIQYVLLKKDAVIIDAEGVRTGKISHTIADFNFQRKLNPGLGQAVGHIALSWSINDMDKLNDETMVEIAKTYLQKMKIQNTQALIVKHENKAHPHLHIIYNRVNNKGKTIPDAFQHRNNIKVCKDLTLKYGFYMAPDKQQVNRQQLKGADKIKYELHDAIKSLSKKVGSLDELQQQLKKQGIEMLYKYRSGTTEVQGISFAKGGYKFKGSEIDRNLSYGNLSKAIAQQLREKEQAQTEQAPLRLVDQLREVIEQQKENQPHAQTTPLSDADLLLKVISGGSSLLGELLGQMPDEEQMPEELKRIKREKKKNKGVRR